MCLIGGGVIVAGASEHIRTLAEKASIPVASTLLGLGAMPHDHPLFLGMLGMHAARCTNLLLEECDLLLALGVRFDDRATGKVAEFCPRARIVHIDIDASEIGKIKQPTLGIEADVGEVLRALEPLVEARLRREWLGAHGSLAGGIPAGDARRRRPVRAVRDHPADRRARRTTSAMITTDVGQHQMWAAQAFPFTLAAPVAHLGRARHDGLRPAGGDRRRARRCRTARSSASAATAAC